MGLACLIPERGPDALCARAGAVMRGGTGCLDPASDVVEAAGRTGAGDPHT